MFLLQMCHIYFTAFLLLPTKPLNTSSPKFYLTSYQPRRNLSHVINNQRTYLMWSQAEPFSINRCWPEHYKEHLPESIFVFCPGVEVSIDCIYRRRILARWLLCGWDGFYLDTVTVLLQSSLVVSATFDFLIHIQCES